MNFGTNQNALLREISLLYRKVDSGKQILKFFVISSVSHRPINFDFNPSSVANIKGIERLPDVNSFQMSSQQHYYSINEKYNKLVASTESSEVVPKWYVVSFLPIIQLF